MAVTQEVREVLGVLGNGATVEMATNVLAWMRSATVPAAAPTGIRPDDILGLNEVAGMLGKSRQTVSNWISRGVYSFPAPVAHLAATKVWDRAQVAEWARGHPDMLT